MFFILHVTKVSKLVLLEYFVEIYKIKNLMILMNLSINVFKQGVSISLGASSPRSINSTTCPQIGDLKFKCVKCGYCSRMRHAKDKSYI